MEMNNAAVWIRELSVRIKKYRIEYPLTQKELAEKAGVSYRCIQNFEQGRDIQLGNLIKILNALDLAENLKMLVPDASNRPSDYIMPGPRQRVRKRKESDGGVFKWGDDK